MSQLTYKDFVRAQRQEHERTREGLDWFLKVGHSYRYLNNRMHELFENRWVMCDVGKIINFQVLKRRYVIFAVHVGIRGKNHHFRYFNTQKEAEAYCVLKQIRSKSGVMSAGHLKPKRIRQGFTI